MKHILCLYLLVLLSLQTTSAQQPGKPQVATLPNDPPKTTVPRVDEPSESDLLPVKPSKGKQPTKALPNVPLLDAPDPNDLLEIQFPPAANLTPNAGDLVFKEIPLTGSYSFNKKLTFTLKDPEIGTVTASSWLNTRTGYAWLDYDNLKQLAKEPFEGKLDQIQAPTGDMIFYTKSPEGSMAMKMKGQGEWVAQDFMTKFEVDAFKKNFKPTKRIQQANPGAGIPFTRQAYTGIVDGKPTTLWLSPADGVRINTRFTSMVTGMFGLGYIALSAKRTYLITGMEQDGSSIFLTKIADQSSQFVGKSYKPVGEMVAPEVKKRQQELTVEAAEFEKAIQAEKDPQIRALMREQQKQVQAMQQSILGTEFVKSSDIKDLKAANPDQMMALLAQQLDIQTQELRIRIVEKENQRKELEGSGTAEERNRLTCEIGCHQREINFLQQTKMEYNAQAKRLAKDPDQIAKLGQFLLQRMQQQQPCSCP